MPHENYQLAAGIIEASAASTWDQARLEWALETIYRAEEPESCLCGHYPIIEICVLRNRVNGNEVVVGNVCVNKFIGLPSDAIFRGVKRVTKDRDKAPTPEAIDYAFKKGWINQWERDFSFATLRKRNLSVKQAAKRRQINDRIADGVGSSGKRPRK